MGTDLGGYAIMIGGTSGAHLSGFSLVDVLSHGRACALMNPYYTVFFAPAVQEQLRVVGRIYRKYGYTKEDVDSLSGRELGLSVANAMVNFSRFLDFPDRRGGHGQRQGPWRPGNRRRYGRTLRHPSLSLSSGDRIRLIVRRFEPP